MPALKGTVCFYVAHFAPIHETVSCNRCTSEYFYLHFKNSVCIVKQPLKTNLEHDPPSLAEAQCDTSNYLRLKIYTSCFGDCSVCVLS